MLLKILYDLLFLTIRKGLTQKYSSTNINQVNWEIKLAFFTHKEKYIHSFVFFATLNPSVCKVGFVLVLSKGKFSVDNFFFINTSFIFQWIFSEHDFSLET